MKGLRYLLGSTVYGGKVTDEWDMRLLRVYLQDLLSDDLANKEIFKPCHLPEYCFKYPSEISSFGDIIDALPSIEDASLFGQNPNSETLANMDKADKLLSNLFTTESGISGESSNQSGLTQIMNGVLEKVPSPFNENHVQMLLKETEPTDSIRIFLLQELQIYNTVLELIQTTKAETHRFINGVMTPSLELEGVIADLAQLRVPAQWAEYYDSNKPLDSWTNDLCRRIDQLTNWIEEGEPNVVWLGGFIHPSSFLTSVLQMYARRKCTSIVELNAKTSWEFKILKKNEKISMKPEDGMYISGMFLEGARWNDDGPVGHLDEQSPMISQSPMPIIHFQPLESRARTRSEEMYSCPVYTYPGRRDKSSRSAYVLSIDLNRGSRNANFWIKRGVAMLLSTSS